ncbi:MAG: hypothetical protein K2Q28_15260 [Hyphomicrobium sp.]|nr:hypothetical protein [Hyphomicrobium sp.]
MERLPFTQTVVGSVFVAALAGLLVLGIQKLMEVDIGSEEKARQEREAADAVSRKRQQAEEQARQEREAADTARRERQQAEEQARQEREAADAARRERQKAEEQARQEREAADAARRERQKAEEQARQEREAADAATQTRLQRNPTWRESPSKGTGSSTIRKWKDWRECQEYFNSIGEAKFCYEQGGVVYY